MVVLTSYERPIVSVTPSALIGAFAKHPEGRGEHADSRSRGRNWIPPAGTHSEIREPDEGGARFP
jgi:hypothetical protein